MIVTLGLFSYGGVIEHTVDSVIRELHYAGQHKIAVQYHRISGDALIPRSRSRALGRFHANSEPGDVLVMVDHDTAWRPGDLCRIALEAADKKALVGGLYCKRTFGKGWSSRVPASGQVEFGKPGLIETDCLATGFLAIPHDIISKLLNDLLFTGDTFKQKYQEALDSQDYEAIRKLGDLSIDRIVDGAWMEKEHDYYDFFRCIRVPSGVNGAIGESFNQFISEDWAFSMRCVHCDIKSYISTFPILTHYGEHGFTIPDGMDKASLDEHNKNTTPKRNKRQNKRARRVSK